MVAAALLDRGVGVEAGLSGPAAADAWLASGLAARCLRVLLEPPEPAVDAALATVAATEAVLDEGAGDRTAASRPRLPRLLHGAEDTAWLLLRHAGACGYATRIGFEDTLRLPDGALAADNAALVRAARRALAGEG